MVELKVSEYDDWGTCMLRFNRSMVELKVAVMDCWADDLSKIQSVYGRIESYSRVHDIRVANMIESVYGRIESCFR